MMNMVQKWPMYYHEAPFMGFWRAPQCVILWANLLFTTQSAHVSKHFTS